MPYVDAARAAGYSHSRIIFRHMAPNVVAPYLIMLTAFIAQAILAEASLSFLGLGVTEPTAAWGLMLSGNAADFYREAPWMILFPGAAITLAVFAFNLFGDALRDFLDPRFKVFPSFRDARRLRMDYPSILEQQIPRQIVEMTHRLQRALQLFALAHRHPLDQAPHCVGGPAVRECRRSAG